MANSNPNQDNLIQNKDRSPNKARKENKENGKEGGIASGISKRKEKVFTKTINDILNRPATDNMLKMIQDTFKVTKDVELTLKEAMVYAQTLKAISDQDTQAFNALVDRVDGKPIQMIETKGLELKITTIVTKEELEEEEKKMLEEFEDG